MEYAKTLINLNDFNEFSPLEMEFILRHQVGERDDVYIAPLHHEARKDNIYKTTREIKYALYGHKDESSYAHGAPTYNEQKIIVIPLAKLHKGKYPHATGVVVDTMRKRIYYMDPIAGKHDEPSEFVKKPLQSMFPGYTMLSFNPVQQERNTCSIYSIENLKMVAEACLIDDHKIHKCSSSKELRDLFLPQVKKRKKKIKALCEGYKILTKQDVKLPEQAITSKSYAPEINIERVSTIVGKYRNIGQIYGRKRSWIKSVLSPYGRSSRQGMLLRIGEAIKAFESDKNTSTYDSLIETLNEVREEIEKESTNYKLGNSGLLKLIDDFQSELLSEEYKDGITYRM
ncbi:MAG: hypothetical protein HRT87_03085 [Legionellales bacterium]|nr:hypothetical protein [Legionellales bacterium]